MQIIMKSEAISLGLKKYFTGKKCKKGHISQRYVSKSTCIDCLNESNAKNIEKRREADLKRYHNHTPEQRMAERIRIREYNSKQYRIDPEKMREKSRVFSSKNKEKILLRQRELRLQNREEKLAKRREAYAGNPELYRSHRRSYYARNAEIEGARAAVQRSKNHTYYRHINRARMEIQRRATPGWADQKAIDRIYLLRPKGMHVDHIIPLKSKLVCGLHCEENLQYLIAKENIIKGNRVWPDMW